MLTSTTAASAATTAATATAAAATAAALFYGISLAHAFAVLVKVATRGTGLPATMS